MDTTLGLEIDSLHPTAFALAAAQPHARSLIWDWEDHLKNSNRKNLESRTEICGALTGAPLAGSGITTVPPSQNFDLHVIEWAGKWIRVHPGLC